jgi:hypothetical protein
VHQDTGVTPFKRYHGHKPDLSSLKVFGSQVCVKRSSDRHGKLDRNDFTGIFLGYTATDQNIVYLDLDTGIVKHSHHSQFDEAWYLQDTRPPAAQLLYDLGLEVDDFTAPVASDTPPPWPPLPSCNLDILTWKVSPTCKTIPLPLQEMAEPYCPLAAAATLVRAFNSSNTSCSLLHNCSFFSAKAWKPSPSDILSEYLIGKRDMATVYMSPDPYFEAFDETVDVRKFKLKKHHTAGLCLVQMDNCLILGGIAPITPAACIPHWRSRLKGAWLIKVGDMLVFTITDAQAVFAKAHDSNFPNITLLFSHPKICQDTSHDGLPIVSSTSFSQIVHDQMNNSWDFSTVADYLNKPLPYDIIKDGDVLNYVTKVMKLTRGKLLQQDNWSDWQDSEYLQLDQYDAQGMFGDPVDSKEEDAIFHLVWTYTINAVDGRKKAHCVCDGSTHSGMVRVLAETYANCVDQTSPRLFYAIAVAENLLI